MVRSPWFDHRRLINLFCRFPFIHSLYMPEPSKNLYLCHYNYLLKRRNVSYYSSVTCPSEFRVSSTISKIHYRTCTARTNTILSYNCQKLTGSFLHESMYTDRTAELISPVLTNRVSVRACNIKQIILSSILLVCL